MSEMKAGSEAISEVGFASLGLPFNILRAIEEQGYETPSPIQAESIPHLLEGKDVLGLAQTGTGKTAAFTLPILARTSAEVRAPQVLVLAPTRELAQQVAVAVESYSQYTSGIKVASIYGGSDFGSQFRALKQGPQWVVGTPGRIMDHIRRGTLNLDEISAVVLDEADEMLRMGFIDDVDWVLDQVPSNRQVALFSATMPKQIKEVAEKHLRNPKEVRIKAKTATNESITQKYWLVRDADKNDAMVRICETSDFDAMMVFVRTKQATEEVAQYMRDNGFRCEALNGDVAQAQRERTVARLKKGQVDIVVATDVAARGLDVERISHVINYDIPYDAESYVHRIGRTGRAGRTGEAILFVRPRERRMLSTIERVNRNKIEQIQLPSADDVNAKRRERFKARILENLDGVDIEIYRAIVAELLEEHGELDAVALAAAIAQMSQGEKRLYMQEVVRPKRERRERDDNGRGDRRDDPRRERRSVDLSEVDKAPMPLKDNTDVPMQRFVIEVGYRDGVKPGNIVGAIANEADIESKYIGHIEIYDDFATVDLPEGMPVDVMEHLRKSRIASRAMNIQEISKAKLSERTSSPRRRDDRDRPKRRNDGGKPRGKGEGRGRPDGKERSRGEGNGKFSDRKPKGKPKGDRKPNLEGKVRKRKVEK